MVPETCDRAYILHQRRYTDSRVILEFLTNQQGVVHAVARTPGKRDRAKFQAFQPVYVEFMGSAELKTLRSCEQIADTSMPLTGMSLFCGLYLNELFQRLLSPGEPFAELFAYYELTLQRLQAAVAPGEFEAALRKMEFFFLAQLGYALDFSSCHETGATVKPDGFYRFSVGEGFTDAGRDCAVVNGKEFLVPGTHLLAIADGQLDDAAVLKSAKLIARKALAPLLHGKPLKSRELFS